MRNITLLATLLVIGVCQLKAQGKPASALAGTSWKGTSYVPDPMICVLQFSKDTVKLIYVDAAEATISDDVLGSRVVTGKDSAVLETMTYRCNADTVELTKVKGGSPCSGEKGQYRVHTAGGKLKLALILDHCAARPYALKEDFAQVK